MALVNIIGARRQTLPWSLASALSHHTIDGKPSILMPCPTLSGFHLVGGFTFIPPWCEISRWWTILPVDGHPIFMKTTGWNHHPLILDWRPGSNDAPMSFFANVLYGNTLPPAGLCGYLVSPIHWNLSAVHLQHLVYILLYIGDRDAGRAYQFSFGVIHGTFGMQTASSRGIHYRASAFHHWHHSRWTDAPGATIGWMS